MKITDETLSAFLDAELPAAEMDTIRDLIASDETIAERVEAFAVVDAKLSSTYSDIDDRPMPAAITALLSEAETTADVMQPTAKILAFPKLRRMVANGLKPAAVAACFTFVMGYGLATMNLTGNDTAQRDGLMLSYQQVLSNSPSGESVQLAGDSSLQVNLSFENRQGQYCRQYTEQSASHKAENIACYSNQQWQLVARHPLAVGSTTAENGDEYRTASGPGVIDTVIDQLIAGPVKSRAEETALISGGWQAANNQ